MNLAEVLVYADIKQLHQIASHYGYDCNLHSKNELITTLMLNLRHSETVLAEVEQLSSEEMHFLLLLYMDKRDVFTLEDLLAKAGIAYYQHTEQKQSVSRKCIANALKRGLIYPAKGKMQGQFQVPTDLREPYIQAWIQLWQEKNEQKHHPVAFRDEGSALCDDVYRFLQFLQKEPVPLTADGAMYRRYQVQLLKQLNIKEEPLAPEKWRFGYGLHFDLYPDRFSLLYDYCYYRQWIVESRDHVEMTSRGNEVLQQGYQGDLHFDVIRFWIRLYKKAIPNLPLLIQLIPLVANGEWVLKDNLEKTFLPWIKAYYYDEPENILHTRMLKMMVHLGLLKVGQSDDGTWLYTSTSTSQSWIRQYNGFVETTILMK